MWCRSDEGQVQTPLRRPEGWETSSMVTCRHVNPLYQKELLPPFPDCSAVHMVLCCGVHCLGVMFHIKDRQSLAFVLVFRGARAYVARHPTCRCILKLGAHSIVQPGSMSACCRLCSFTTAQVLLRLPTSLVRFAAFRCQQMTSMLSTRSWRTCLLSWTTVTPAPRSTCPSSCSLMMVLKIC
jgi:hypothetical protein